MCVVDTTCVWGTQNVCGARKMCVGDTKCVWGTQNVCGRHKMCVGDTKCVWERQNVCGRHKMCVGDTNIRYMLHVTRTRYTYLRVFWILRAAQGFMFIYF